MTFSIELAPSKRDVVIVPLFEGKSLEPAVKELNTVFNGQIKHVIDSEDFVGKKMQTTMLFSDNVDMPRILLVGLGKTKELTVRSFDQALGAATIAMSGKKYTNLAVVVPAGAVKKFGAKKTGVEIATSIVMADYAYDEYKKEASRVVHVKDVQVVGVDAKNKKVLLQGLVEGQHIGEAANFARELGNTPPSHMTPTKLGKEAEALAKKHKNLTVTVLGEAEAKKLGMGGLLGVGQGSTHESKFIILEYNGAAKKEKPSVLVGKGITFDSGGLSLKPAQYMTDMKFDMLGAATVLGTIDAIAHLGLKKNVVGLISSAENMPSGESFRPDDILVQMEGISIEIGNTDAEGRLVLSDALSYAKRYQPKEVIDFATLTGACVVAVGQNHSGLFSPVDKIADKLYDSAQAVGEQLWRLPLGEEFSDMMKSQIADIKNVSDSRYAGASTAAAFLQHFTNDVETGEPAYPWAHIDLSSSYNGGKGKPWIRAGANGFGVQTMVEYLR